MAQEQDDYGIAAIDPNQVLESARELLDKSTGSHKVVIEGTDSRTVLRLKGFFAQNDG